jgi:hypothetical protein
LFGRKRRKRGIVPIDKRSDIIERRFVAHRERGSRCEIFKQHEKKKAKMNERKARFKNW